MTTAASKSGYTVADLAREFAGEFTKEEIQQHLQGTTAPSQPSAKVSPCVFVAGLCWATTSDRLYDFFGSCGAVVSADVSMDRGTGRSRGFGKVTFASLEAADKALLLHDAMLDGRPIVVRPFHELPPRDGLRGAGHEAPSFEVLVDSISWHTNETSLRKHFEDCGEIISCAVFYDRKTGQHKGVGKLSFACEIAAQRAVQRHLSDLDGWTISVRPGRTFRAKAAAERKKYGSEAPDHSAGTSSFPAVVDIPKRVPPTCLLDWLAELDPAGFLLCYLPTLLTMGHRTPQDIVHRCLAEVGGACSQSGP
ncbi:unnamed protein product [Symbiodinium natans]|uniref:RRM domain-containing protein n=1 Tax=Symbiodinium natans TaxID=878477 RepID=A0A812Q110_9DINO|nr:unnamed protein product [Symbiodinium natans]